MAFMRSGQLLLCILFSFAGLAMINNTVHWHLISRWALPWDTGLENTFPENHISR